MKKILILSLALFAYSVDINTLFEAIEKTPDYKLDKLAKKEIKIAKKSVTATLYPKITLQASIEHFNRYNSMVPLTPTESSELTKTNAPLPFSQNIQKIGFVISMPIFVKSIYDNKEKMQYLLKATNYQTKINLYQKQTLLVGYLSQFDYLYKQKSALYTQYTSIKTTYKALKEGVKVGRIAEFKLLRLKDSLNKIKIKLLSIDQNIQDIQSNIFKLTNINLKKPIYFESLKVNKGDFFAIKPLKEKIKSSTYSIKAKKDNLYPKITLQIKANRAYAKAYNTDSSIKEDLASVGIYVSWDLFNKKTNSDIQKEKIDMIKNSLQIQKTKKDLIAQIVQINHNLKQIKKQIAFTKESLKLKESLLKGAKVAFRLNRMSVDEYLKYEDDLANIKASLANLYANQNILMAQKAFIYGKNLKKVFK